MLQEPDWVARYFTNWLPENQAVGIAACLLLFLLHTHPHDQHQIHTVVVGLVLANTQVPTPRSPHKQLKWHTYCAYVHKQLDFLIYKN